MRFDKGWFKMNREDIAKMEGNSALIGLYVVICANASYEKETFVYRGSSYKTKPGELLTTYKSLKEWARLDHKTLKRYLDLLVDLGLLKVKEHGKLMGFHPRIIQPPIQPTVQSIGSELEMTHGKSNVQSNPESNTFKEYKEYKNINNRDSNPPKDPPYGVPTNPSKSDGVKSSKIDFKASNEDMGSPKAQSNRKTPAKAKKAPKGRITSWEENHAYGGIFKNLMEEKYYRAVFDVKLDEKKIKEFIERYSVSIKELEEISFQYQNWCSSKTMPIKSPRGTLVTFIRNHVNSKANTRRAEPVATNNGRGPDAYGPAEDYFG